MFLKSWLNKMKSKCLPPSARKVMRMENTLLCRLDELSGKLEHLNTRLDELSGQHGYLDGQIQALSARNDLLFWFSHMRESEGLARTKRNFFEKFVPEEGLIRGTQLVMLNLLDFIILVVRGYLAGCVQASAATGAFATAENPHTSRRNSCRQCRDLSTLVAEFESGLRQERMYHLPFSRYNASFITDLHPDAGNIVELAACARTR